MRISIINNIRRNVTINANGESGIFNFQSYDELLLYIRTRGEIGNATLTLNVQSSPDRISWVNHGTALSVTATGTFSKAVTNFGKYVKITWVITGGTSFTGVDIWVQTKG